VWYVLDGKRSADTHILRILQRLGGCPKVDRQKGLEEAAELAANSDVAIVVVGLNSDWEAEGFDRPNLSLPLNQDELIYKVAAANPSTVVVIQAVRCLTRL
jgi:beta-glucosidase